MGAQTRGIADPLIEYGHVGLDTMCFIYHFEANPKYIAFTNALFNLVEEGKLRATTSTLTLAEILIKPIEQGNKAAVDDYKYALTNFPNLVLCDINAEIAEEAASLKVGYGVRLPDALQVATSIIQGARVFITNNQNLKRIKETEILIVRELLVGEF